jgi:hypothetical protein
MNRAADYADFVASKSQLENDGGFEPTFMPDVMFDFQKHLSDWAIRKGRAAELADCGLGKTLMELVFAENVLRRSKEMIWFSPHCAPALAQTSMELAPVGVAP